MPGTGVRQFYSCPRCRKHLKSIPGAGPQYGSPLVDCSGCSATVLVCGIYESALFTEEQRQRHESVRDLATMTTGVTALALALASGAALYYLASFAESTRVSASAATALGVFGAVFLARPMFSHGFAESIARRRAASSDRLRDRGYRIRLLEQLLPAVESADSLVAFYAIRALGGLGEFGPEARAALPVLERAARLAPWSSDELNELLNTHAMEAQERILTATPEALIRRSAP